jgi:hypothetical protein
LDPYNLALVETDYYSKSHQRTWCNAAETFDPPLFFFGFSDNFRMSNFPRLQYLTAGHTTALITPIVCALGDVDIS